MSTDTDVTELQETVEMATLDKEMAEEKVCCMLGYLVGGGGIKKTQWRFLLWFL